MGEMANTRQGFVPIDEGDGNLHPTPVALTETPTTELPAVYWVSTGGWVAIGVGSAAVAGGTVALLLVFCYALKAAYKGKKHAVQKVLTSGRPEKEDLMATVQNLI